ncbi:MAG: FecR domain-containing protein, partial [Tepidisphaerales bacterium]
MKRLILMTAVMSVLYGASPAWAADSPGAPATQPQGQSLKATITGVEGIVQVRDTEDDPWKSAKVGMVIGEGAEFRTGPKSAVRFEIPPDQTVTLDRLGTVKLIEAIKSSGKVKTDLGMQYGRVRYDIEAAGLGHDSTIHSPGATLAVRGTKVSLYDQPPFKPQAVSLTGVARFKNAKNQSVKVGGDGKATVDSDQSSVAQNNLGSTVMHSESIQQADQQARELAYLASHQGRTLGNVAASNVPVTDSQLPSLISGNLDFVLRWSGPHGTYTDLNIVVRTPLGETFGNPPFLLSIFPDNAKWQAYLKDKLPPTTPSGGAVGLNSIGPEGIEIASFGKTFPAGIYVVSAYNFLPPDEQHTPGTGPKIPFKIEVFLHG